MPLPCRAALKPVLDTFDERHGRLTRRRVFVHPAPTELNVLAGMAWSPKHSGGGIDSDGQTGWSELRQKSGISFPACPVEDERQIAAIRQHWSIENSLHWVLDVTFQEDTSRVREQHARRNLALLRKIAINLIHQSTTTGSVRGRRKQAAWDNDFMAHVVFGACCTKADRS